MKSPNSSRSYVPWDLGFAFAAFVIYFVAAPIFARIAVTPLQRYFPDFGEDEPAAVALENPEADAQAPAGESTDADPVNDAVDAPDANEATMLANNDENQNAQEETNADVVSPAVDPAPDADASEETTEDAADVSNKEKESVSLSDFLAAEENRNADEEDADDDSIFSPRKIATQHPMARLLIRSYHTPNFSIVVLLFFVSVVFLAPLAEELIFRVVIQGTTEKLFRTKKEAPDPDAPEASCPSAALEPAERAELARKLIREENARRRRCALAVLAPAILFALLHVGAPEDLSAPDPCSKLFLSLVTSTLHLLIAAGIIYGIVIRYAGATASDLGLGEEGESFRFTFNRIIRFVADWSKGALLLLLFSPLIFGLNAAATELFPESIVAPIPIFFFALVEGVVYFRTKRFATILGMHMTLNFCSFAILMRLIVNA